LLPVLTDPPGKGWRKYFLSAKQLGLNFQHSQGASGRHTTLREDTQTP
jgi:hypothetical protein